MPTRKPEHTPTLQSVPTESVPAVPEPPTPAAPTHPAPEPTQDAAGPGIGARLATWAKGAFVPPEIWATDRPSLSKQLAYARSGDWGPEQGWPRYMALAAFWAVSFPTSVAAYAIEWTGERPARWVVAVVLISLIYQLPYVPELVGLLLHIPAWPITATWALLGLT